jgi:hypothetical protein
MTKIEIVKAIINNNGLCYSNDLDGFIITWKCNECIFEKFSSSNCSSYNDDQKIVYAKQYLRKIKLKLLRDLF